MKQQEEKMVALRFSFDKGSDHKSSGKHSSAKYKKTPSNLHLKELDDKYDSL